MHFTGECVENKLGVKMDHKGSFLPTTQPFSVLRNVVVEHSSLEFC